VKLPRAKNAQRCTFPSPYAFDGTVLKYRQLYYYGYQYYSIMNKSYLYILLAEFQVEKVQIPVIIFQIL
jgi:hypothetical protein